MREGLGSPRWRAVAGLEWRWEERAAVGGDAIAGATTEARATDAMPTETDASGAPEPAETSVRGREGLAASAAPQAVSPALPSRDEPTAPPPPSDETSRAGAEARKRLGSPIRFAVDEEAIAPPEIANLTAILVALHRDRNVRVIVEGHADRNGGDPYNEPLSARRAWRVYDWLTRRGVDAGRVRRRALGSTCPAELGSRPSLGREAADRRVEVLIDDTP